MEVTLRRQRLRYALCHDEAVGHLVRCRFCGVFMHTECKAEFGRCPSLGCVASAPPLPAPVVIELSEAPPADPVPRWVELRQRLRWPPWWALVGACVLTVAALAVDQRAPSFFGCELRVHEAELRRADAKAIGDALKLHRVRTGRWARSLHELMVGPEGPFLDELPRTQRGEPYRLAWELGRAYVLSPDAKGDLVATLALER